MFVHILHDTVKANFRSLYDSWMIGLYVLNIQMSRWAMIASA